MATRRKEIYVPGDIAVFKRQALQWAATFSHVHLFNNNGYTPYPYGGFANRLAAGCLQVCPMQPSYTFESIQQFHDKHQDWLIGYFSYDVKNELEELGSKNPDNLQFPAAYFYIPQHLIHFENSHVIIETTDNPDTVYGAISSQSPAISRIISEQKIILKQRTSFGEYTAHVERIQNHILEGDVYELNYCLEFYAQGAKVNPLALYLALNNKSPMPFSVYGRIHDHYLICASPERFLKKTGARLISQPMKGTARRGNSAEEDERIKQELQSNEKERAENMMIVDLVRNDLARSARTGSVRVEEMFGIYTFPQVHQMISTVSAQIRQEVPLTQAIKYAFPMGSMTGAPKIKAMQLIDFYEQAYRGLYSGAAGYITPQGDFDFNVVIRSILYNARSRYLSFEVGSAITYDALASQEYEECLLKAGAMQSIFTDM